MALQTSTGLRNKILDTSPLRAVLNLGAIKLYAGPVPATADAALGSATLLTTVSNNSTTTGLTFAAAAAAAVLSKASAEVWSGLNVAGGVASFYRHVAPADTGTLSTTEARIQGTCATAGADMNLTNTTLAQGATHTVDFYQVNLPTA
jgi:hypothetical protein